MTITVKGVIKAELLRVCLETTTKFRTKHEKKEKKEKYTSEEIEKVRTAYKSIGWTEDQVDKQMVAMAILHDAPELKKPTIPALELFCIMVCEKNVSSHPYGSSPFMFFKKRDPTTAYTFHSDGTTASYVFQYIGDAPRFATDDEVKAWANDLTDAQYKTIRIAAEFSPIWDAAMAKAVQVEDTASEEEEHNGEISIYDRSITVTDE